MRIQARSGGALVVAQLLILAACGGAPAPSGSTGASQVPSADASASPGLSAAAPGDDLGSIAWWATEDLGFGIIPEAPVDPNPPVQPDGFRQLTIGTLDGRITAVLPLHWDWGHSYVSGPYGTDVLVANDTGSVSEVFMVSALDGTRTDLFTSPEIIAAVALGDGGTSLYYVELGRDGLDDRGVFQRHMGPGDVQNLIPGPLGDDRREPSVWWLTADPLEDRVVAQSCFGQVACTTHVANTQTGMGEVVDGVGWPLGADATTFFGDGLGPADDAQAIDVRTGDTSRVVGASRSVPVLVDGEWRFVRGAPEVPEGATLVASGDGRLEQLPGDDSEGSELLPLGERRGVALPPGWVLRWPMIPIQQTNGPMGPSGLGQLIEVATATRVDLAPFELVVRLGETCDVPIPSAMPNGARVGFGVLGLVEGVWTVRWGAREEVVTLQIDEGPSPVNVDDGAAVSVRGHAGRAVLIGDEGVGEAAFTWNVEDCAYTVWLPAGTTLVETVEYAAVY